MGTMQLIPIHIVSDISLLENDHTIGRLTVRVYPLPVGPVIDALNVAIREAVTAKLTELHLSDGNCVEVTPDTPAH